MTVMRPNGATLRLGLAHFQLEHGMSGEANSLYGLKQMLESAGVLVTLFGASSIKHATVSNGREKLFAKVLGLGRAVRELPATVKEIDCLQLHLPTPAFSFVADYLVHKLSIPVVVRYDSLLVDEKPFSIMRRALADPVFYLPRLLINNGQVGKCTRRRAAHYIVSSKVQRTQLIDIGYDVEKISVISNFSGVRTSCAEDNQALGDLVRKNARPVVTYFGHLFQAKGVDVLLRAIPRLTREVTVVIAESGLGQSKAMRRLARKLRIEDRVVWLGKVDVPHLVSISNLVVLPYRVDYGTVVYPNALLETFEIGCPVVTTSLPVTRELCEHYEVAYLAAIEDAENLALGIDEVLSNIERQRQMIKNQKLYVESRLNKECLLNAYCSVYQKVLQ